MVGNGGDCGGVGGGARLLGGEGTEIVEGMLDYKGMRAVRSKTGRWRSTAFTIGVEMAERFAFYGIAANLITYLTGPLRQSTVVAAVNVNVWAGFAMMLPLLGAFVADSYLGRYRTILFSALLYIAGLGLLTLSAIVLPSQSPNHCQDMNNTTSSCLPPPSQVILFFTSLYIVAIAQGGHKPCTQAFAADQFDGHDSKESKSRSSFFNWWFFALCLGSICSHSILVYIQDNMNWALGFGIPCISMAIALVVFLLGTKTYRYSVNNNEGNPFQKIGLVFVAAAKNWRSPLLSSDLIDEEATRRSHHYKFLDKALIDESNDHDTSKTICSASQVDDAKSILQLIRIWCTCLMYGVVFGQVSTFFTKQGSTMDRSIGSSFQIPSASLLSFTSLSTLLFIPIYDCVIVPIARVYTNKPSGITMLQRIGFGTILLIIAIVMAALVEKKRLKTALDYGLIDVIGATIPMSIWWLVPQYCLLGIADVFTLIGLQEFFYDQVPNGLESLGIALYSSMFGVGCFVSGFLVSVIEKVTSDWGDSWFSNNLNQGHLDYFYWLLAGLSTIGFVFYLYFARLYVYNKKTSM